ncbi:hypothetical protein IJD44_07775 [bacterium]|nr:hypothetical protein [bacterium]
MNDGDLKIEERIIKRLDILKNVKLDKAVFNIKDVQDLLNLYNKEKEKNEEAKKYILKKQSIQYKYALSKIECEELLKILEGK